RDAQESRGRGDVYKRQLSSDQIARENNLTAAQVRKDLSYFGAFGRRGLGYNVQSLYDTISRLLGLNKQWNVVLIGLGNIGRALVAYDGFRQRGFNIRLLIDSDPNKVNLKIKDLTIRPYSELRKLVPQLEIKIAILSVPAEAAQAAAEEVIAAGCRAILNFAPVTLQVPDSVYVRQENMAFEIESLSFLLTHEKRTQ
ncbi:MAG: redox-sensing transcriptional repressor Rex, partial [bacterium]|nr:redox-sensing transcriptional repressor Rex [bacterium]